MAFDNVIYLNGNRGIKKEKNTHHQWQLNGTQEPTINSKFVGSSDAAILMVGADRSFAIRHGHNAMHVISKCRSTPVTLDWSHFSITIAM